MERYDHKVIEKKWQDRWEKEGAYRAEDNSSKPKTYVLDMFPYPSGFGIHMGHVEAYTATDIYTRYKRTRGFNVLHPMGWDAFGLPAENYAIKTGVPPQQTTDAAINNFRRQIKALGLSYDWSREVGTHNPDYYRWTQWLFTQFFEKGLVYKKKALVNWDPVDQTVLANEQVLPDGTAERSGAKVEKRDLEQWFFKITDYADELADSLDEVDWPESTKINQRNWIGRSEGAEISFKISRTTLEIKVFTTRPDTLFGATYIVLAPEHPFIMDLAEKSENKKEILAYVEAAKNKSDIERGAEGKEKTGVELKGVKAINPSNKEEIPVFIADYVLGHYGTGAIMAVPAHDDRDLQFAFTKNEEGAHIEIAPVIRPYVQSGLPNFDGPEAVLQWIKDNKKAYEGPGYLINSDKFDALENEGAKKKITEFVGGIMKKTYRLRDWLISRQRYWGAPIPIVYDPSGTPHAIPAEHLPWILPTDVEFKPTGTSPLGQSKELAERTERIFGKGWKPEVDTMDTFACSSWYFFRFTDPHNEKEFASHTAMQKWLPVDLYMGGAEHTVLHLLYARFFTKVLRDMKYISFDEPFLKLCHQGTILAEDGTRMSKSKGNVVNPDTPVEEYGADAVRLYSMFMGPLEASKPWITENITGVARFVERVWKLAAKPLSEEPATPELEAILHKTAKKVGEDIEAFKFNTAISQMMICLNAMEEATGLRKGQWKAFVRLLAPFAPHIAEELWERLGEQGSVHKAEWPQFDPAKIISTTATVVVQINGKLRAKLELLVDMPEAEALSAARATPAVAKWLEGKTEKKAVYVPGKIVSFSTE